MPKITQALIDQADKIDLSKKVGIELSINNDAGIEVFNSENNYPIDFTSEHCTFKFTISFSRAELIRLYMIIESFLSCDYEKQDELASFNEIPYYELINSMADKIEQKMEFIDGKKIDFRKIIKPVL